MAFPEGFLRELKLRNDITDVASSYVNLRRRGRNMIGLCPFHGEKTPSFNIYTENGSFYCFGCGVGGDVITFIMKIENLDYVEAVKFLAQRAGIDMPENSVDDSMSRLRTRVYEANREAARFFYKTLCSPAGREGLDYFHSRMLSDQTIRHFGLGFADDNWSSLCAHLKSKGFSEHELVTANLAVRRKNGNGIYDRFTNRVMFPIIDLRGNVIAFGGRIMTDQKPKYLNTSDTPVFKKSENLFSLNNAKNTGSRSLILCEGYMDVISVNQAGFENAVATLGTALTSEQAVLMKRYADEVIICYDVDEAGQKATARAIPILRSAGMLVKVINIPNGKDPDEFIKSKGADGHAAFKAVLEKSGNDVEYRLQKLRQSQNTETSDGRVKFLEESAKLIAALSSPIERDVYASKICEEFKINKSSYVQQINTINRRRRRDDNKKELRRIQGNLSGRNDRLDTERYKIPRSTAAEEGLVVFMINHPDSEKYIASRLSAKSFKNPLMKRYYEYFSGRIKENLEPLNNISADFTDDESSKLFQMLSKYAAIVTTKEALDEYIEVIKEESSGLNKDNINSISEAELMSRLNEIKKTKQ